MTPSLINVARRLREHVLRSVVDGTAHPTLEHLEDVQRGEYEADLRVPHQAVLLHLVLLHLLVRLLLLLLYRHPTRTGGTGMAALQFHRG